MLLALVTRLRRKLDAQSAELTDAARREMHESLRFSASPRLGVEDGKH
jgi:hypothetical protein